MIKAQIDLSALKLTRMEKLYSRYGAADRVGVHESVIDAWETGAQEITEDDMRAIVKGYNLTHEQVEAIFGVTLESLLPPAPPSPETPPLEPYQLNEQETLVLALVSRGAFFEEIAEALNVQVVSARHYVKRLKARIGDRQIIPAKLPARKPKTPVAVPDEPPPPAPDPMPDPLPKPLPAPSPVAVIVSPPSSTPPPARPRRPHILPPPQQTPPSMKHTTIYRIGTGTVAATISPRWLLLPAAQRAKLCEAVEILERLDTLARAK